MNIEVRDYKEEDLDEVNEILRESFSCEKGTITGDEFKEIVATVDGKVAGYLILTRIFSPIKNLSYYFVDYVCVLSTYRGHGIGKELLDYAYQVAKADGMAYLQLTSSRFRISAHKLYEKCNFVKRDSDIFRKEIV